LSLIDFDAITIEWTRETTRLHRHLWPSHLRVHFWRWLLGNTSTGKGAYLTILQPNSLILYVILKKILLIYDLRQIALTS